jgi:hypothetical protein
MLVLLPLGYPRSFLASCARLSGSSLIFVSHPPFCLLTVANKNRPPRQRGSRLRHWLHPLRAPIIWMGFSASTVCSQRLASLVTSTLESGAARHICHSAISATRPYATRPTANGLDPGQGTTSGRYPNVYLQQEAGTRIEHFSRGKGSSSCLTTRDRTTRPSSPWRPRL